MEDTQDMTATEMDASSTPSSPRLQEFQSEVDKLKVTGGRANPERAWLILSIIGMLAGVVISLMGWLQTHGTSSQLEQNDFSSMAVFGVSLTIAATGVFIVMSIRRYFRYWLVRLIFEQREQTDRVLQK
jgi:prepilin signal peptidase PulO-like enzyme (type II secretory pathway)